MNRRDEILSKVSTIPAIPTVIAEIRKLLADTDANFKELSQVIKYDLGLTTNLLRLANSAYFGFTKSVNSVHQAVVRLGTKRVYELAVAAAVAPMAKRAINGYDLSAGKLWEHSVAVAIGAEQLASVLSINLPDYTFTAGLLCDIGKIILGTFVEVNAEPIMAMAFKLGIPFDVAERRILGIDHAEVGAVLLERWNIPGCIVDVTRWHHKPDGLEGDKLVVDLVHVADALTMMGGIGIGRDGLNYRPSPEVASRLKLTTRINELVVCKIMSGLNELNNIFTLKVVDGSKNGS